MIKFFRQIRKNLLMENKTYKYFKYAIGEILLVVVGILIALQINNWNDLRKLKQQETTYYCKIQEDLNADILNIDESIASLKKRQDATRRLLTNLLKMQEDKAVLFKDYLASIRSQVFVPTKAAIEDITSSGKLENLRNQDLKSGILNYYVEQDYTLRIIESNNQQIMEKVFAYMDYTDFGIQELPLYEHIYGDELQQLLKSKDWQKDPNSRLFRYFRDHMNMTLIITEREQDLLSQLKETALGLSQKLESYCVN
jgi:hypothetical protein